MSTSICLETTIDVKYLRQIFKDTHKMFGKLQFEVYSSKLAIYGMDDRITTLLCIELNRQYFDTYKFHETIEFLISSKDFSNFTKELNGLVSLRITSENVSLSDNDSSFSMKIDTLTTKEFEAFHKIDDYVKVPLDEMIRISRAIDKYKVVEVDITSSKECVKFKFYSDKLSIMKKINNHKWEGTPFSITLDAKFFITVTKMFNFSRYITFFYEDDHPFCLEYSLKKERKLKEEEGERIIDFVTICKSSNKRSKNSIPIPTDIYDIIFSYLSVRDISNFCATNSRYLHLFSKYNCVLWKILLNRDYERNQKRLSKKLKGKYMDLGCGHVRVYISPRINIDDNDD